MAVVMENVEKQKFDALNGDVELLKHCDQTEVNSRRSRNCNNPGRGWVWSGGIDNPFNFTKLYMPDERLKHRPSIVEIVKSTPPRASPLGDTPPKGDNFQPPRRRP